MALYVKEYLCAQRSQVGKAGEPSVFKSPRSALSVQARLVLMSPTVPHLTHRKREPWVCCEVPFKMCCTTFLSLRRVSASPKQLGCGPVN